MLTDHESKKLYKYQIQHTDNIIRIITNNTYALDASDTGTGKTYCAIAACSALKLRPLIVCPKTIISTWKNVCEYFNVEPINIVNYELAKNGKCYKGYTPISCPYLQFDKKNATWKVPKDCIFIFDEAHKCCELSTQNAKLLLGAKNTSNPIIMLSATIADFPEKFRIFFYMLNFIDKTRVLKLNIDYKQYIRIVESWITRDQRPMVRIHNMLYPDRASRMRIDALGDLFPRNQIVAIPYTMDQKRTNEIQNEYKNLAIEIEEIKNKSSNDKESIFPKILRAHQKIEILKIPIFVELANDFIHNGHSVVIFVNFTKTLETLADMFYTKSIIYGDQSLEEREQIIEKFQENKTNIIICNIKAGGIGISLHDINGGHPRVSLISPTWSAINLVQALGRIHRAGAKTPALQRIIYVAETVEEKIADKLKKKLSDINSINNGDLDLTNIEFENRTKKY